MIGSVAICLLLFGSPNQGETPCDTSAMYATNDYLYRDTYFTWYTKIDTFPIYPGGKDSLQSLFKKQVEFEAEEKGSFSRCHIVFIVNCDGTAEAFELMTKPFPGHEKILKACEKMKQWRPGIKYGKTVKCYYRLGFINHRGSLKVDYREK